MKTNTQDDTDSVNKSICEPNEKCINQRESDSDLKVGVKNVFDEVQWYKLEQKLAETVNQLQLWKFNER